MINGKNKGNTFERKVAKILSDWSGQQFNRVPLSGALRWETNDKRVVSDVVPPPSMKWPFSVECKCVEHDWDFSMLLIGTSTFWKHWEQANGDAQREEMIPMLVFTKNYRNTYVAIYKDVLNTLEKKTNSQFLGSQLVIHFPQYSPITILDFGELLNTYKLSDIQKLC